MSETTAGRRLAQAPVPEAIAVLAAGLGSETTSALPIASISTSIPLRGEVNAEHVRMLADAPGPLPPVVVHRATGAVIDGRHRLRAAVLTGHSHVNAVFFEGTVAEALLLAVHLNSEHGLPLSRQERREAVQRILLTCPSWSDRRVGALAGVSHRTVAAVRARSGGQSVHPGFRIGLDGREHPVDPSAGRVRVLELLRGRPDAATRQLAVEAGVAPSTVHAIRRSSTAQAVVRAEAPFPRPRAGEDMSQGAARSSRARGAKRADLPTVLPSLRADPSVTATLAGRGLLRLLSAHAANAEELAAVARSVPAHRRGTIADLAHDCAERWLRLAGELERAERFG